MIKFKCAIHKKTGQIISYEDWQMALDKPNTIFISFSTRHWRDPRKLERWDYRPLDIILSDDFEIIQDDDFNLNDYIAIDIALSKDNTHFCFGEEDSLFKKIQNKINSLNDFECKYGRRK